MHLSRHSLKQEREKNVLLNRKLLNHYLLTTGSDLQILPDLNCNPLSLQPSILSPIYSTHLPSQQSTPNDNSRILLAHTPTTPACSITINSSLIISPTPCAAFAFKQQVKLAGSNMFRYYSSII